ncbi:MAG: helix-turn-helix domain-containing protein [Candidatus Hydrogenedentes bacterium]|nr:helix-turn-helix domain-containing protein [Candidatus Hydrogenedentota bacterium]
MEKILTVNDVADILQVKAITVREMFREKRLRGFKVGKAWRTTEPMLREDIAALARGESPEALPAPGDGPTDRSPVAAAPEPAPAPAPTPPPAPTPASPTPTPTPTPTPAPTPAPAPASPTPDTPSTESAEKPRTPRKATTAKEKDDSDDDTQQLLF